jgi:O-antigen/teichoic acid export membrane protein
LLARLSNTSQIAIFSIGLTLYNYVYMFAGAINGFFLPTIYRHRNSDDNEGILRIGAWASSIQFYVVGLCVFGIAAVGRDFIDLWVGDSFSVSWWVALLLLSPCIITFSQAVEWTELFASNKLQYGAIVRLCTAVSTLVLSIVLIPKYHAVGSALAIGISFWIFQVFVMNFVYAKVLKRSRVPFLKVLCRYLVVWVVALWIYYRVSPLIWHHTSWINLLTQALCFGILYTVLAYAIAIPRDVKQFVLGPMLQRISKLLRIRHN